MSNNQRSPWDTFWCYFFPLIAVAILGGILLVGSWVMDVRDEVKHANAKISSLQDELAGVRRDLATVKSIVIKPPEIQPVEPPKGPVRQMIDKAKKRRGT